MFARNCGEPQLPLPLPPASLPFCLQWIPFLIKAKKEQERGCDDLQGHDLPVRSEHPTLPRDRSSILYAMLSGSRQFWFHHPASDKRRW